MILGEIAPENRIGIGSDMSPLRLVELTISNCPEGSSVRDYVQRKRLYSQRQGTSQLPAEATLLRSEHPIEKFILGSYLVCFPFVILSSNCFLWLNEISLSLPDCCWNSPDAHRDAEKGTSDFAEIMRQIQSPERTYILYIPIHLLSCFDSGSSLKLNPLSEP